MKDLNGLEDLVGFGPENYGRSANRRNRIAVRCGDRSVTWAELGQRVHRLARAWENRGFERGDKVATFLPNRVEILELMYSLGRVGMVNVTINAKFLADEFERTVQFSDAVALVVDAKLLPIVNETIDRLQIAPANVFVVGGEDLEHGYSRYDDLLAAGDDEPIQRMPHEDDTIWMAFTGGTTGPAKACLTSHRGMVRLWTAIIFEMGVRRSDIGLIASSMNHALGIYFGMTLLHLGGTLHLLPEFDPVKVLETIETEKVTFTSSAPSLYTMVLDAEEATGPHDLSSMRLLVIGGAAMSTPAKKRLHDTFPQAEVVSGYGGTESGLYGVLYPEDQLRLERSAGVPPLGIEVKIVDEEGNECAPGEVGTIYGRGWHTAVEYYKQPDATAAQFEGDWHTLDDMGYVDEEGYLYVTDRRKNMIVSSGINVFPAEIESVLAAHPGVVESAVIGIPDEKWGEVVCAIVVRRPGVDVSVEDLDAHCRARLARYKVPRRFEFREDLPRTYAGKVSHRDLRAPFWESSTSKV